MAAIVALASSLLFLLAMSSPLNALSVNYYDKTCPKAESLVKKAVKKAMGNDQTVPAALLRMHFHDCFIRVTNTHSINLYSFIFISCMM